MQRPPHQHHKLQGKSLSLVGGSLPSQEEVEERRELELLPRMLPLRRNLLRMRKMSSSNTSEPWVFHTGAETQPWETVIAGSMLVVIR